jgi:hypothetical protein
MGREDLEVHDRLVEVLPDGDERRAEIVARRERLAAQG